ncbi:peptidyl-tRNA hydrolase [Anaplasma phagocytophilum str. CRT53-1]|uniref:Peptidyl-tRNA hydrolase n=1 Tax=Anaplasma phagocytophilum str. CRT53-1 TaxID=1359157 RepID=A0A0F3PKE7_ANAPH|nr:aminoacyl-tRNA hydrolase [Anaplasma phagocytophilum]KJV80810.1 peptidyl-tRNA hydrolase [Anaplasma phagocytophilum str. CRT53-1]
MLLLVGLGNPGKRYAETRHNVGFMIIDAVARSFFFPEFCSKHDALVSIGNIGTHRVMLMKPLLYMNRSGTSVLSCTSMHKITPEHITVFHDDVELQPGTIRVKLGGGSGGHNGLRSIDSAIGKAYWRVRFGVGRAELCNLSDYVLSDFENIAQVTDLVNSVAANLQMLLDGNAAGFVSKVTSV